MHLFAKRIENRSNLVRAATLGRSIHLRGCKGSLQNKAADRTVFPSSRLLQNAALIRGGAYAKRLGSIYFGFGRARHHQSVTTL